LCGVLCIAVLLLGACKGQNERENKEQRKLSAATKSAYKAVPTDAIAILDFEKLEHLIPILNDTTNFGRGIMQKNEPLVKFQEIIAKRKVFNDCHVLFTLHYSSKNEVTFLEILDMSTVPGYSGIISNVLDSVAHTSRKYNGCDVREYPDGFEVTTHGSLLVASSSAFLVESSVRHLANGSSILDFRDFMSVLEGTGGVECMYLNHKQIGKLFSGFVTYDFLKYSDFLLRFSTWSALEINPRQKNFISFRGTTYNNGDPASFSSVFLSQEPAESQIGKILPASTMFCVSLQISGMKSYLKAYRDYLEVNKKLNSYLSRQLSVTKNGERTPQDWAVSQNFTEVATAFCVIGGKYNWFTVAHIKPSGWSRLFGGVKDKIGRPKIKSFKQRGYFASVFGEAFSHTKEEVYCRSGEWMIIGSRKALTEFIKGGSHISLDSYLNRTPASDFLSDKGSARVLFNIKEGSDTLFNALNPYFRKVFTSSIKNKNFEYFTATVGAEDNKVIAEVDFYAAKLAGTPEMFKQSGTHQQYIDSTIKVSLGPFLLVDPQTGDTSYIEQSPKFLSIAFSDKDHKGLWALPFKDTLKGSVGQVVYGNKVHMAFIVADRLCLMTKRGAYAGGYPLTLPKKVACGPAVIKEGDNYFLLVINADNTITKYALDGTPAVGWKEIHAPEFTRELPRQVTMFGHNYLVMRTIGATRIYNLDGTEVTARNWRRPIAKDSRIVLEKEGYIKVMGVDGKEFLFNLKSGRIKKL